MGTLTGSTLFAGLKPEPSPSIVLDEPAGTRQGDQKEANGTSRLYRCSNAHGAARLGAALSRREGGSPAHLANIVGKLMTVSPELLTSRFSSVQEPKRPMLVDLSNLAMHHGEVVDS